MTIAGALFDFTAYDPAMARVGPTLLDLNQRFTGLLAGVRTSFSQLAAAVTAFEGLVVEDAGFPELSVGAGHLIDADGTVYTVPSGDLVLADIQADETWWVFVDETLTVVADTTVPPQALVVLAKLVANGDASDWASVELQPVEEFYAVENGALALVAVDNGPLRLATYTYLYNADGRPQRIYTQLRSAFKRSDYVYDEAGELKDIVVAEISRPPFLLNGQYQLNGQLKLNGLGTLASSLLLLNGAFLLDGAETLSG